ncbi:MAG: phosphoribosylamine--glycine ligase [Caldilinea sp. CFX5]|nr:phosphoribosylamine--glycine ligase [Caldilinea sp. CFX5]
MRVLIVGNGGREHAIAWKLTQSSQVQAIFVAPGNGGLRGLPKTQTVPIEATALAQLRDFAQQQAIDLTIVGPEAPLVEGIVDHFRAAGLAIFGPTQAAARLEGSKAFAKAFLQRHGIPTAQSVSFTDFDDAMRYLRGQDEPPVVKASGLAAGKGVILPETLDEAAETVKAMLLDGRFGRAGEEVVLEERLRGEELSVLAFCDGRHVLLLPAAQDHKRLLDRDRGPNTGGMGAFAPAPAATPALLARVTQEILLPTLAGMAAEGTPYQGVLYAGLMLTAGGPKVLEFNCRLGDPETQVILPLLQSDLLALVQAAMNGTLDQVKPQWAKGAAVTVVMASRGYPEEPETGFEISGIAEAEKTGATVFHAGTKVVDQRLVNAGGRVLAVTGVGDTLTLAANQAYHGVRQIHFTGAQYRRDIAYRFR